MFLQGTQAFTVCAWVYCPAENWTGDGCVVSKREAFILHPIAGSRELRLYVHLPSGWNCVTCTPTSVSGWHHYAGSYDGRTLRLFVDGVLLAEAGASGPISADSGAMAIGHDEDLPRYWRGYIAGVELWDHARSQIADGMWKRLSGSEPGLVGYWPLDDGTVRDLSPNRRHGTVRSSPVWTGVPGLHPQQRPPAASGARVAKSMSFDGVDDYVKVPAFTLPADQLTISIWVRSDTDTWNAHGCHLGKPGSFLLHPWMGERRIQLWMKIGAKDVDIHYTPSDIRGWHLYSITYDGQAVRLYFDGYVVAEQAASGVVDATFSGMTIGHDARYSPLERNFKGQLASVALWNIAKTPQEVLDDMYRRPTGRESGLFAYWPLDSGPQDVSPRRLHGSLVGKPELVTAGSSLILGQGLRGELAEVRAYSTALLPAEVKASMHLPLSGKERGLEANYRLGAISYEREPPFVVDFSYHGRNATVHGDPYAGALRLGRATGSGKRVVRYGSDELVAVSRRAVYEETFEFRVLGAADGFDPKNADGTGQRIFAFSYWGKSSRGSREVLRFSSDSVQERDYQPLEGGWWRAACRVVVPDGISLMRAFELSDVKGRWSEGSAPPAGEWTGIEVRKHRIRLLSDTVTCERYTDTVALVSPSGAKDAAASLTWIDHVRFYERDSASCKRKLADLNERIVVAQNQERYRTELTTLNAQLNRLADQQQRLNAQRKEVEAVDLYYYFELKVEHSGMLLTYVRGDISATEQLHNLAQRPRLGPADARFQHWEFILVDKNTSEYQIRCQEGGRFLSAYTGLRAMEKLTTDESASEPNGRWIVKEPPEKDGPVILRNAAAAKEQLVADVLYSGAAEWTTVILWPATGGPNQAWRRVRTDVLAPEGVAALKKIDDSLSQNSQQTLETQKRIAWLTEALAPSSTDEAALTRQRQKQIEQLAYLAVNRAEADKTCLERLKLAQSITMPTLAIDARGLTTTGAVLDFANSTGSVTLLASCTGNVLLSYFDLLGRLRCTPYDATADSRNARFEQWLPEAGRAWVYCRDLQSRIRLAREVSLPGTGWTAEAWVQYPFVALGDGTPFPLSLVASQDGAKAAPLAIRNGEHLGLMLDGWFFDSGLELNRILSEGAHHLAVTVKGEATAFYVDGMKLAQCKSRRPTLRFNGKSQGLEVPAHDSPTKELTVSVWVRCPSEPRGTILHKGSALKLSAGSDKLTWVLNTSTKTYTVLCATADVRKWHLHTLTYDGSQIRIFLDGAFQGEIKATGDIVADGGKLAIGYALDGDKPLAGSYFSGELAELNMWSRARFKSEVARDFRQPPVGDEPDLACCFRMEKSREDGIPRVKDLTPNGRHAALIDDPWDPLITTLNKMAVDILGNSAEGSCPIGRLAEVRLWSTALSDAELAANFQTVLSGNEPGLVGYWPLDEIEGTTARDHAVNISATNVEQPGNDGTHEKVEICGCSADIGNPGTWLVNLPDSADGYILADPGVSLANQSFSIECWARRGVESDKTAQILFAMGSVGKGRCMTFGFRANERLLFGFWGDDFESNLAFTSGGAGWRHYCATYDKATKIQSIYLDGHLVGQRTATADFSGSGPLYIGRSVPEAGVAGFRGDLAEVRVWNKARSQAEIKKSMRMRLTGREANLLAYYPLNESSVETKVQEKKSGEPRAALKGSARRHLSTSLPLVGGDCIVGAEYSTVEAGSDGTQQALMRRFFAYVSGGNVSLLPEQRLEALGLQWIGNTQISPLLLGYIEGAPPVPSENLTADVGSGYEGATSVTLQQKEGTSYSWQRSESHDRGADASGSLGAAWDITTGVGIMNKATSGSVVGKFKYSYRVQDRNDSTVSSESALTASDRLTLTGMFEDQPASKALGKRWIPKNVGYALVISGMADVFITKLKRTGRMVSYDVRPMQGVPLDVNTITFMINPAYVMNGSLDGMVGTMPADPRFYGHVPGMRAQYGSLYPASYFRLKEAYSLKESIQRQDKEREAFFYSFHANKLDDVDAYQVSALPTLSPTKVPASAAAGGKDGKDEKGEQAARDALNKDLDEKKKSQQKEAEKRQAEIEAKIQSVEGRVRASGAFLDWQTRMGRIQAKASKRNIVNTYVWDGDGGLRAEQESFAGAIEHSMSTDESHRGGGGAAAEGMYGALKFSLEGGGEGGRADAHSKKLSTSSALELNVDLSGVEKKGITNLKDEPLKPGEKVDRYRFMTFYLEGSTDNFDDFFSHVVDPEWLQSNDEEARALRMASAKTNKCWRVLHRVTYVERPI